MFGRRDGDHNPRRFWSWFAGESHGLANGIEALTRGETDAEWLLIGLNQRIQRYSAQLEADLSRTLDGKCLLTISGRDDKAIADLLAAAPALSGWRIAPRATVADQRRVPFRLAPPPSLDILSPIQARHEAYAV
ncbi:MAG: hypothetical protein ABI740_03780 [Alphaproteobacteria bacterium]